MTEAPEPSSARRKSSAPSGATEAAADNGSVRAGRTSPVVRKLALEHGVNLEQVEGSGARGRVTREDVMKAAETHTGDTPRGPTGVEGGAPRAAAEPQRGLARSHAVGALRIIVELAQAAARGEAQLPVDAVTLRRRAKEDYERALAADGEDRRARDALAQLAAP